MSASSRETTVSEEETFDATQKSDRFEEIKNRSPKNVPFLGSFANKCRILKKKTLGVRTASATERELTSHCRGRLQALWWWKSLARWRPWRVLVAPWEFHMRKGHVGGGGADRRHTRRKICGSSSASLSLALFALFFLYRAQSLRHSSHVSVSPFLSSLFTFCLSLLFCRPPTRTCLFHEFERLNAER